MGEQGWLENNLILKVVTGSRAYGTNTEESDWDYKGVTIPPIEYYLGNKNFKEMSKSTGGQERNTKDDVDISIMSVNTFVNKCAGGSPESLELLFLREQDYLVKTELGQLLVDNREIFLTKQVKRRMGGYARSQEKRMTKGTGVDKELGYDTKSFMHSVRLYEMLFDILDTGTFTTYRDNREYLKELRKGKYSLEEALECLREYENVLDKKYEVTELPKTVDDKKVNELLIKINMEGLGLIRSI